MDVLTGRTAISASAASEDEEGGAAMSLVAAMRGAQRLCDAHGGIQSWLLAPVKGKLSEREAYAEFSRQARLQTD